MAEDRSAVVGAVAHPAAWLRLMRPHQWLKNLFVCFGPVFGHRWDGDTLGGMALSFLAFCAMASAIYVFNDAVDASADRLHATKRSRPIASGTVSIGEAGLLMSALVLVSCLCAALADSMVLALVLAYAVMNVAYSLRLKHVVLVDVFVISAGFMLRLLAGTAGLGIAPSSWLLLCGLMVTLFLGFAKRRAELLGLPDPRRRLGDDTSGKPAEGARKVLSSYNAAVVDQMLSITAACTVLCYALYTVSPETVQMHSTNKLVYTVPLIVYGMFRYLYLLHAQGSGQDTARDLLQDRHLLLTALVWVGATLWILL